MRMRKQLFFPQITNLSYETVLNFLLLLPQAPSPLFSKKHTNAQLDKIGIPSSSGSLQMPIANNRIIASVINMPECMSSLLDR